MPCKETHMERKLLWPIVLGVARRVVVRLIPGLLAALLGLLADAQLLDAQVVQALLRVLSAS